MALGGVAAFVLRGKGPDPSDLGATAFEARPISVPAADRPSSSGSAKSILLGRADQMGERPRLATGEQREGRAAP
ncbi:MAG: hypothetical protein AAGJ31_15595, partial [Verrucomicrobiota bacterium]